MDHQVSIRVRRDADLPTLVDILRSQQPHSLYPLRWPLPFPAERFIVREAEEQAWVAETPDGLVGHVALTTVPDDDLGAAWSAGSGRPISELVCVSVLFVGIDARGVGVGRLLLDTAERAALASGRTPVLDVVNRHSTAVSVYRHRGWVEIGRARPDWLPDHEPPVLLMALKESGEGRRLRPPPQPRPSG